MSAAAQPEQDLVAAIARFSGDPLGFVMFAFPWGVAGTALADKQGPDDWQIAVLNDIRDGLASRRAAAREAATDDNAAPDEDRDRQDHDRQDHDRQDHDARARVIRQAVASGHGIGKSALVAWLLLWSMATHEETRGVVTANTENQLKTKTWAELAKWHRLFIGRHWFTLTATALFAAQPGHDKTWRIDRVAWSERNTEAFAGLHNEGKRVIVIFDEASAIPDIIWETTEGALTDDKTQILWLAFGNPTRNSGRFRDCFGRLRHRWRHRQIDSRNVRITNKAQLQQWVDDYGEDSDFVRVRVKGVFPRAGSMQFIAGDLITAALAAEPQVFRHDALVLGVDVARFGDDESVIFTRKGRDARFVPPIRLRNTDTMTLAGRVAEEARRLKADAIFVDEGGVGGGVVDRLRQLGLDVIGVQFGAKADGLSFTGETERYANKRAELYGQLRQALKAGLALPQIPDLITDLTAIEYGFNARDEIQLEKKEQMKVRGLGSPDLADALALTYAYPVMAGAGATRFGGGGSGARGLVSEFEPY